jgi:hypothetical protein
MTTIATITANSWTISIGGGWIVLTLIGMGLCFVFMLGSMWLMRDGRGWTMCSRWLQQTPRRDVTGTFVRPPEPPASPESEGPR